jgi:acylaminoacyl-peptidase
MTDAEAYHEMVSAAVDLTSVYVRNGIVSGKSTSNSMASVKLVAFTHSLHILLQATRSVRDIDTNSRRSFLYNIPLVNDDQQPFISPPTELPAKIKARIPSPSGNKLAVLVEENIPSLEGKESETKRNVFEIWTDGGHRLANRIVLPKEMHGPVCTDFEWFGGISWSPDETVLVYNAEVPSPKTASFFDISKSADGLVVGGQYTLGLGKSETWGEKYMSTALLGLFCLNVETGRIGAVENTPMSCDTISTHGGYVLGQVQFSPCGKSVAYTGWDAGSGGEMPRRLGAIYCFQRPCKIYSSPVSQLLSRLSKSEDEQEDATTDSGFECITPKDRLSRSPRFSHIVNGRAKLAYLCHTKGFDTHGGCMALHVADWDVSRGCIVKESGKVVVDVISIPSETGTSEVISGIQFPGLFLNQLPAQCFSPDLKHIVATTEWGCTTKVISVSLKDGSVAPVKFNLLGDNVADDTSQRFLCFTETGAAIVAQSAANRPTVVGRLQPDFLDSEKTLQPSKLLAAMSPFSCTSSGGAAPCFKPGTGYTYQIINVEPEHGDVKVPVGNVLLLPDNAENEKLPLIVVPHGGPHTCMPSSFERAGLSYAFLCKQGRYAILHVNFRGSTGFGQAALESLAGKAGSLDVLDCVAAAKAVIDMGYVDPERVGVCGGSHGKCCSATIYLEHLNCPLLHNFFPILI